MSKESKASKAPAPRQMTPPNNEDPVLFHRASLEKLLKQRFFYAPAFEIYGGVAGLYDYGPAGCAVKGNMMRVWRSHFVLEEGMSEVDCAVVTPAPVLSASGHAERFFDLMVRDEKTKELIRADHLVEDVLGARAKASKDAAEQSELEGVVRKAESMSLAELGEAIRKYKITSPAGNNVSDPAPFNLMFGTQIGPTGDMPGFLRPETAQGIFVNFKRLLEYNAGKMPFAAAQIGKAYRNEIAPRQGLLRLREFELAEIEHFCHPEQRAVHPKFHKVSSIRLTMLTAQSQENGDGSCVSKTVGEAVEDGTLSNQTLGYFAGRISAWFSAVGIRPQHVRFRQHMTTEMAHYAADCWDAEVETSYGWIECVGLADRSAYDLKAHSKASKIDLQAREHFAELQVRQVIKADFNRAVMGKAFTKKAPTVQAAITELSPEAALALEAALAGEGSAQVHVEGETVTVTRDMVKSIKVVEKKVGSETYFPHVIEPAFGIGRCFYAMLEHSYWAREGDEDRGVLSLMPEVAAVKTSLLPLFAREKYTPFCDKVADALTAAGVSHRLDDTGASIGKRYARTDEIGIPFGITVDDQTCEDNTVTLRERDTTMQVRLGISEVASVVADLCSSPPRLLWSQVYDKFPHFAAGAQAEKM